VLYQEFNGAGRHDDGLGRKAAANDTLDLLAWPFQAAGGSGRLSVPAAAVSQR
jgi:hypothetical protein